MQRRISVDDQDEIDAAMRDLEKLAELIEHQRHEIAHWRELVLLRRGIKPSDPAPSEPSEEGKNSRTR